MRVLIGPGLDTGAERPTRPTSNGGAETPARTRNEGVEVSDDDLRDLYAAPRAPWLRVNFVSTVDGAATGSDGRSGSINNEPDGRVFHLLRELCDVVVVGAGTARAEGYRPTSKPVVVVSLSGAVPATLRDGDPGQVLLATCSSAAGLSEARLVLGSEHVLTLGEDVVDLVALKTALADRGFGDQLCEGGPHLFDGLLAAGVVDELCASQVPRLVGGEHTRITAGLPIDVPLRLTTLLEEDGTLLGRWFA